MLSDTSDSCPFLKWFVIFGLFIEIYRGCHYSIMPSGVATKKLRVWWGKKFLTLESDSFHPVESYCMEPSNILLILISEILKCKINVQSELMKYRRYHVCKLTFFICVSTYICSTSNIHYFKTTNYNVFFLKTPVFPK